MTEDQKYLLDNLLRRIDIYTNSINSKAAFLVAFNTFVLGTSLLKYNEIVDSFRIPLFKDILNFLFAAVLFGAIFSLRYTFNAIDPYLKSGNDSDSYKTLLFFGSVGKMTYEEYKTRVEVLSKLSLIDDMIRQTHVLSEGLNHKFGCMSKSVFCLTYFVLFPVIVAVLLRIVEVIFIPGGCY